MPQKNAQDRLWKILNPVLLVLAVLAMAKTPVSYTHLSSITILPAKSARPSAV